MGAARDTDWIAIKKVIDRTYTPIIKAEGYDAYSDLVMQIDISMHGRCTGKCNDCGQKETIA